MSPATLLPEPLASPLKAQVLQLSECRTAIEAPSDPTQLWWWDRCAPLLESLLTSSKAYTVEEKADHMRTLRDFVVPTLGLPTHSSKVTPLLTFDGSPFEPSWNFTQGKSIVRYSFEPLGETAGTDEDPFAGALLPTLIPALAKVSSDVDLRWFEQIIDAWFVQGEEASVAKAALPPHIARVPQNFLAFDLKGSKRSLKSYFFPILKHLATGISNEQLTWNLIRGLKPCGDQFEPSVNKLEKYLGSCPFPCSVEMIAIDCIDPSKARIKIYARSRSIAKSVLRHGMTLGGVQTDDLTMAGIQSIEKIWHLLHDERTGMSERQDKLPKNSRTHHVGICFVFEMRANAEHIDVKIQGPSWNYQENDLIAAANFTSALQALDWDDAASKYSRGVTAAACLPGQDYSKSGGLSYWSYNYGKDGPYLSSYISPMCSKQ